MSTSPAFRATLAGFAVAMILCSVGAATASADASADRDKASEKLRHKLTRGDANAKALREWFAEATKGRKAPKKATQEALADAVAEAISDRKMILSEAMRLSDGLAAAAIAEGISKAEMETKKEGTLEVLEQMRAEAKAREAVSKAYDQAVKEQQQK
jgi:hypothetical protein